MSESTLTSDPNDGETYAPPSNPQDKKCPEVEFTDGGYENKFTIYDDDILELTKPIKKSKKESKPNKPKSEPKPDPEPSQPEPDPHPFKFKQVILVRTDLKLSPGKLAAQVAHAAVNAFNITSPLTRKSWLDEGHCKIVLQVADETALIHYYSQAKDQGLPVSLIKDFGLEGKQASPSNPTGISTVVAIGPAPAEAITNLTAQLRLY